MDITLSHLGVTVVINVGNSNVGAGIFDVTIDDEALSPLPFGGDAVGSFKVEAASPDAATAAYIRVALKKPLKSADCRQDICLMNFSSHQ